MRNIIKVILKWFKSFFVKNKSAQKEEVFSELTVSQTWLDKYKCGRPFKKVPSNHNWTF